MSKTLITLTNGTSYTLDADNDAYDSEDGDIRLVGFQDEAHVQRVNLLADDWRKGVLQRAVGMFPVFSRQGGGLFHFTIPVESVHEESGKSDWTPWGLTEQTVSSGLAATGYETVNKETDERLEVTFYQGEADGKPVVQIDGAGDFRINVNDAPVWDQSTERGRLVWVATVTDDTGSPEPAVYVSDTRDGVVRVVYRQQGVTDNAEIWDWMERNNKVLAIESYYIEDGWS